MIRFRTLLRRGLVLGSVLGMNLIVVADAWARKKAAVPDTTSSGTGRTVIAYVLVGLLIAFAMIVACRPAKRASGIEDVTAKSFLPALLRRKKDNAESTS